MDSKQFKSLQTANGHTYSYYYSPPSSADAPTLLLIHGFPDTAKSCYRLQTPHFQTLGYGIIAPNILGYPGTSAPTSRSEYVGSKIASSIISILDHEKINEFIVIGHDWGSIIGSRIALLAPERVKALVLACVGAPNPYAPKYSVEMIHAMTEKVLGYPTTAYVQTMQDEAEGAGLLKDYESKESFRTLIYPEDGEIWKTDLMPDNAAKNWITSRKNGPMANWLTQEDKDEFHSLDFTAVTQYYASMVHNDQHDDTTSNEALMKLIEPPTLLLLAAKDRGCPPMFFNGEDTLKATYKDVEVKEVESGHWMIREKEKEWRDAIFDFLKGKGLL